MYLHITSCCVTYTSRTYSVGQNGFDSGLIFELPKYHCSTKSRSKLTDKILVKICKRFVILEDIELINDALDTFIFTVILLRMYG